MLGKCSTAELPFFFFFFFFFRDRVSLAQAGYVSQAGLELLAVLLPQPPELLGLQAVPPCLAHYWYFDWDFIYYVNSSV
jgi:hypothetical protein